MQSIATVVPFETPFMTLSEAAVYLRVSTYHLRHLAKMGKVEARKHGGKWVFLRTVVIAYSESKTNVPNLPSVSRFEEVRSRLRNRSLKTEHTEMAPFHLRGGS